MTGLWQNFGERENQFFAEAVYNFFEKKKISKSETSTFRKGKSGEISALLSFRGGKVMTLITSSDIPSTPRSTAPPPHLDPPMIVASNGEVSHDLKSDLRKKPQGSISTLKLVR